GKMRATFKSVENGTVGGTAGVRVSSFEVRDGQVTITKDGQTTTTPVHGMIGFPAEARLHLAAPEAIAVAGSRSTFNSYIGAEPNSSVKTEMLPDQVIEGVRSRGTRISSTIETGKIGNDRSLTSVSERWYSDDLQVEVMSKRTDPRTGEQTFRLVN